MLKNFLISNSDHYMTANLFDEFVGWTHRTTIALCEENLHYVVYHIIIMFNVLWRERKYIIHEQKQPDISRAEKTVNMEVNY